MYGTESYSVLGVKSKFADWVKNRLADCEAAENEDFEAISKNLENGGRVKEYIIKLDTAKEMAMLERNEKGKQVRRYFIRAEKKYKEAHSQPGVQYQDPVPPSALEGATNAGRFPGHEFNCRKSQREMENRDICSRGCTGHAAVPGSGAVVNFITLGLMFALI